MSEREKKGGAMRQAVEKKREISQGAGEGRLVEVSVPAWMAALMLGIPQEDLKKTGILVRPEREGRVVIAAGQAREVMGKVLDWRWEKPEGQEEILAGLYESIYELVQAHVGPGANILNAVEGSKGEILDWAAEKVEGGKVLRGVNEYIVKNRGKRGLSEDDLGAIHGLGRRIFEELKQGSYFKVEEWERRGWVPDNMFTVV